MERNTGLVWFDGVIGANCWLAQVAVNIGRHYHMEWLIARGANVNPQPNAVYSPLVAACEVYQHAKIELLLAHGAEPNARVNANLPYDHEGNLRQSDCQLSPLLVAIGTWYGVRGGAAEEPVEVVEMLISGGADLHQTCTVDIDGEILELTSLGYTRKLASLFPDRPFEKVIEVLQKYDANE